MLHLLWSFERPQKALRQTNTGATLKARLAKVRLTFSNPIRQYLLDRDSIQTAWLGFRDSNAVKTTWKHKLSSSKERGRGDKFTANMFLITQMSFTWKNVYRDSWQKWLCSAWRLNEFFRCCVKTTSFSLSGLDNKWLRHTFITAALMLFQFQLV